MNKEEATAWLNGERSMCNMIPSDPDGYNQTGALRIAQADAAMTQQAYWIMKAHSEGLLGDTDNEKGKK